MDNWIYVLRILIALLLGFAIGFERKLRLKEAGIRTHSIVAAGACLFMIVSKYGFQDMEDRYDASRIAAQIVSGIGFIGAGMILYRKQAIQGLTTAAGVWTTAGVGMAVGAGLYIVSVGATVLIILIQCIMHINCKLFRSRTQTVLTIVFACGDADNCQKVKDLFGVKKFHRAEAKRVGGEIVYTVTASTESAPDDSRIRLLLEENPFLKSVETLDSDL